MKSAVLSILLFITATAAFLRVKEWRAKASPLDPVVGALLTEVALGELPSRELRGKYALMAGLKLDEGPPDKQDPEKAISNYLDAVKHGNFYAEYFLGRMYMFGRGVPKDRVRALEWFLLASSHRVPEADYMLAQFYRFGLAGVEKDLVVAERYYDKAKQAGVLDAFLDLGKLFSEGKEVSIDQASASRHFCIAFERYTKKAQDGDFYSAAVVSEMLRKGLARCANGL